MKPLYIETTVRCEMAELWRLTQDPACHERWDLRFTRIQFAAPHDRDPKSGADGSPFDAWRDPDHGAPVGRRRAGRRFRYATTVLPGLTIGGVGVTVGERVRPDGTCTSALRFGTNHPLSMIKSGSGYWRYVPTGVGIRFLTGYDYRPGLAVADVLFRPLLGWATAWSFDRLRLWAERGITPRRSLANALVGLLGRIAIILLVAVAAPAVAVAAPAVAGPMMATAGPLWTVALTAVAVALTALAVAFIPPGRDTPSASRCLRRPPDRLARTAPSTLDTLELS